MILIYDDGIYNNTHVMRAIHAVLPNTLVHNCGAHDVVNGCLDNAKLLIMPGGADLYLCEKLNGIGNEKIRSFVKNGGSYLGICAGAYYACSSLDWNDGEIDGSRELAFYEGTCTGPVYKWVEDKNNVYNGSWIQAVEIKTNDATLVTHYNGGGIFSEPNTHSVDVIARYSSLPNTPPAVISGTFGKGRYILSSPHIEKFGHLLSDGLYKHLNKSYEREKTAIDQLLEHEQAQKDFFKSILQKLL
jgi:glutamine amidotransferase-like uncharacterized protein